VGTPPAYQTTCVRRTDGHLLDLGPGLDARAADGNPDHVAGCVPVRSKQGAAYEEIFALADGGRALRLAARTSTGGSRERFRAARRNHRVRNNATSWAYHMHVIRAPKSPARAASAAVRNPRPRLTASPPQPLTIVGFWVHVISAHAA